MSTSNISQNNIINIISKDLLKRLDPSIANDVIKDIPKQLYKNLKKNNLLKKEKNYKTPEDVLSEDDYKSESLETNSDYISSTNLPYNIPVHQNNLYQDNMQPKYKPGSYRPPRIMSTGIEGFDGEDNKNQNVPVQELSPQQSETEKPSYKKPDIVQDTTQDTSQQPPTKNLASQQTTTQQPTIQQPTTQQPTIQQPTIQQPTIQQPTTQQPITQQIGAQQSTFQQRNIPFNSLPLNILSLDLRQLVSFSLKAIGDTYGDIYDLYKTNSPITIMSIISILFTDNRILYLGISFLLIAIIMYIMNNFIKLPLLFGSNSGDKKVYINSY